MRMWKVMQRTTRIKRTCRTIKTIAEESTNDACNNSIDDLSNLEVNTDDVISELPNAKPGVRLANTTEEWHLANAFYHANLPTDEIAGGDIDELVTNFSTVVYNYFRENYGIPKNNISENKVYSTKYKSYSNGQLKSAL